VISYLTETTDYILLTAALYAPFVRRTAVAGAL